MNFEKKITLGFVMAVLVQTGGALVWAGAAAERITVLERTVEARQPVGERLARVEAGLDAVRTQLDRMERKLEAGDE
ncbi:MAG: hypothetical protein V7675_06775 [Hyphomonas sp.]|uniref:hypothetical protein n=1 Tax=Hyphomonas sp. TaxID=87 RepID=UPI0030025CB3